MVGESAGMVTGVPLPKPLAQRRGATRKSGAVEQRTLAAARVRRESSDAIALRVTAAADMKGQAPGGGASELIADRRHGFTKAKKFKSGNSEAGHRRLSRAA